MSITKQTKVAVVCGGISSEREISLRSGKNCFEALRRLGYSKTELVDINNIQDIIKLKEKNIEIAFLTTHGKYGEDGSIQGIFEWLKIPYTGSSVIASAVSMDKWLTKEIAKSNVTFIPDSILLQKETKINLKEVWNKLSQKHGAVFLKPRDDGSSVNISKMKTLSKLEEKIKTLDLDYSDYIIEEFISGKEITISIIEVQNKFKVLPILELKSKNEFYDYEAKYTKGLTEFILPAKLDKATVDKVSDLSLKIFTAIGCNSFGRVDFIIDKNNNPYLLEVNSLPGMTDTSDLPAQAKAAGIEYDELVEIILKTARLHK